MANEDHLLIQRMSDLIQEVTMVKPLLDELRQIRLLTDEQYDLAASKETTQEQMRELYRHVIRWPYSQLDKVSKCLQKTNPVVMAKAVGGTKAVMAPDELRDGQNSSTYLHNNIDPVALTCGHNCRVCIKNVLHEQVASEAYTGSKSRTDFKVKKAIKKMNIAEDFPSRYSERSETGIFFTNYNQMNALDDKSCPVCDNHLNVHSMSAESVLPGSINSLQNRKHNVHKNMADSVPVSVTSLHKDYNSNQVEDRTSSFVKKKLTSQREDTEEIVQNLLNHGREVKKKAADIERRINVLFEDMRKNLEVLQKSVLSEIFMQENQVSQQVSGLIQHLDIKKEDLSRKMHHMEELCNMSDPVTVFQEYYDTDDVDIDNIQVHGVRDLDVGLISAIFHTGLSDIITGIKRGIYVQELADILLDVNTAENHIHISDDLKTVSWSQINMKRPDIPERFDYSQALSTRGFSSGVQYWEVEVSDRGAWRIGMSYSSVGRKGEQASVGNNDKSWCLCRWYNNMHYVVLHNRKATELDHNLSSRKFGIYVNYEAGQLSFYTVCHPAKHLHTFSATFTEPLHAAIYVWDRECDKDCWVRIRSYEK